MYPPFFQQRREGMKPWLQGRLALSQQTSRFELPMDVKLLAGKKYSSETLLLGSDINYVHNLSSDCLQKTGP